MNDETDSESVKLRIREPNNEKPPPKPIQLKIRKNWTELVCRRIYILTWIRNYDQTTAYSDFIAGVTLGLTMIPQAIAYASIAGMDPHYGLYAAFIGIKTNQFLKFVTLNRHHSMTNRAHKIQFHLIAFNFQIQGHLFTSFLGQSKKYQSDRHH